jgi:hypothetical protein
MIIGIHSKGGHMLSSARLLLSPGVSVASSFLEKRSEALLLW